MNRIDFCEAHFQSRSVMVDGKVQFANCCAKGRRRIGSYANANQKTIVISRGQGFSFVLDGLEN